MSTYRTWKVGLALCATLVLASCGSGDGPAELLADVPLAEPSTRSVQSLALPTGMQSQIVDEQLARASGPVDVWITLADVPVAALASRAGSARAMSLGTSGPREFTQAARAAMRAHRAVVLKRQNSIASRLRAMGVKELGRVHMAHNAIAATLDASQLSSVAALPGVMKVRRVKHYELSLGETVPYIGATAVQQTGFDGTGVRVAVIDSGVDYTHRNLGGAGTPAAYEAAFGTNQSDPRNSAVDPSIYPTEKVVGGYDFVGDTWPHGPSSEDPNPIDKQGHGTHVADIIAGKSRDGKHKGVAPGAKLLAIKVCSSVSSSCNGVAILKALDFSIDPNGDGDLADAVDVINLSLGSNYGEMEDDSTEAVTVAVNAGIVVVAAAGNGGNVAYIVGSPSIAPGAISVAQTAVPYAANYHLRVNLPSAIARDYVNTETLDWAPIGAGFTGDAVFVGTACPGEALLANPKGKVALIDRGTCSVSLKVANAAAAGARGVLLALTAAGDPESFSNGGGESFVPTVVIQKELADAIKAHAATPVNVTVSDATRVSLVGGMVKSSSRGPSIGFQTIKPEIGAPGASLSAVAGGAIAESPFGGTSGATPMVAGAVALLLQAFPDRGPIEIKAMLMNSASTQVYADVALLPGRLAPITRIGAGEARVANAIRLGAAVWDPQTQSAALSFGAQEISGQHSFEKSLLLKNFSGKAKTFTIKNSFRYADDEATRAVNISAPAQVKVEPHSQVVLNVAMSVDGAKMPEWKLGGERGERGDVLDANEFDGYLTLTGIDEVLSVPWHILPRRAAATKAVLAKHLGRSLDSIVMTNRGGAQSDFDVFALTGTREKPHSAALPGAEEVSAKTAMRAVGVRYLPASQVLQFAIASFERKAHPSIQTGFTIEIDANRDGSPDYVIASGNQNQIGETGANIVSVTNLSTKERTSHFYADADFNSANTILSAPLSSLGLKPDQQFNFTVTAHGNDVRQEVTDTISSMTFTPSKPRFAVVGEPSGVVRARQAGRVDTTALAGGSVASPSQTGFLVMLHRNAGNEAEVLTLK